MAELLAALHKYFGFKDFRPGQLDVIEKVMDRKDVLAVMPTGRGKSLCYQLPGLMLPGVTLVISPLVALMKDQVDSLHTRNLHQVTFLNSQLTWEEQKERLKGIKQGDYKIIYVAPERLRTRSFNNLIKEIPLSLLVVDEAHCISQWGHDFRPDYLYLREFIKNMDNRPRVLSLTATATPKVQQDIMNQLGIDKAAKVAAGSDRPNLYLEARKMDGGSAKLLALANFFNEEKGSGIIYTATRRDTDEVAQFLISQLNINAAPYHAGMDSEQRVAVQEGFLNGTHPVVVATNAFGMGIDKHDIRFVIHYSIPSSLEAYYQEVGRAGRDGKPAQCLLFYVPRDRALHQWMIDNDSITREHMVIFWKAYQRGLHDGRSVIYLNELDRAGVDENRLRLLVGALERSGVISLIDRNGECLEVETGFTEMGPQIAQLILSDSQKRQSDRRDKLAVMVNWINSGRCRRTVLLEYFGENLGDKPENCCNNCTSDNEEEEYSFAPLEILRCVKELRIGVGRKKLASILQGSKAKDIIERDYHLVTYYGKLKNFKSNAILAMIDRLLGDGYLITDGEYPVLELTSKGWEAISMGNPMSVPMEVFQNKATVRMKGTITSSTNVVEYDKELLTALKEYRGSLAKQEQKPPYIFFNDQVLEELARHKPKTMDSLKQIPGIGSKKLSDHGKDLLAIIGYHKK
ncbi:MAG: ATP-dependent DNA helicase RecQ [Firmicutes bacterium]|nr:ATP-dependent DNA helicase RecQ [Bacillota bacterium]